MTHPIVVALASGDAKERRAACQAAIDDPSAVLLVDAIVGALADPDVDVVRAATAALERIGRQRDDDAVLTALAPALRSDDPRQQLEAAWAWARLEPPPVKLLPAVVSGLEHATGDARWRAARLLVELGRIHGEVAPVIIGLAAPTRPAPVRRIALTALRELAPGAQETLVVHLEACRDTDVGLARLALTGLAGLRQDTPEVWAQLADVMAEHEDPICRRVAATAIGALGSAPPDVRETLARGAASDTDPSVRQAAERALGRLAATPPAPGS